LPSLNRHHFFKLPSSVTPYYTLQPSAYEFHFLKILLSTALHRSRDFQFSYSSWTTKTNGGNVTTPCYATCGFLFTYRTWPTFTGSVRVTSATAFDIVFFFFFFLNAPLTYCQIVKSWKLRMFECIDTSSCETCGIILVKSPTKENFWTLPWSRTHAESNTISADARQLRLY
jgi:hypothetical protein